MRPSRRFGAAATPHDLADDATGEVLVRAPLLARQVQPGQVDDMRGAFDSRYLGEPRRITTEHRDRNLAPQRDRPLTRQVRSDLLAVLRRFDHVANGPWHRRILVWLRRSL
jgi:hypothetical protein